MTGNIFGKLFRVTSFGESHGPAIGCVIDGCPPRLALDEEKIQSYLNKRRPGQSKYTTQRFEADKVRILSGVYAGLTTGMPITLLIENQDCRSQDYEEIKNLYRPGHADFTYHKKYGHRDHRGGGRASARETVARVAAGAVARLYLAEHFGIEIYGFIKQVGEIKLDFVNKNEINNNPFFCPNLHQLVILQEYIDDIKAQGDSVGACVSVVAHGVPVGFGDPVFDKLDATISYAMMSINAAKGVEIGTGFGVVSQFGSEHRDEITNNGFLSNNSGGVLGGISTGQDINVNVAFKPTSSILKPAETINVNSESSIISVKGRHDPCVGIRAVPITEAMLALVLLDHALRHRAQIGLT